MLPIEYLYNAGDCRWGNPSAAACLYYPGAFTDTGPLDLILRSRSSHGGHPYDSSATAIYVDINITPDTINQLIDRIKYLYLTNTALVTEISPGDFGPYEFADFLPGENDPFFESFPDYAQEYALLDDGFFGIRAYFPEIQFMLIYIKAEGIQAYRVLQKAKIYPNIVVLQDHGPWGYQFATFYGESLLYKASKVLPRYLYLASGGDPWPGFQLITDGYCDQGQEHRYERYLCARKSVKSVLTR